MTKQESHDDSSTRLQILINTLNLNGLQFAKAIGVSQSFVSIMQSGQTKISRSVIDKIGKAFPLVNIHWLITGDGEMFLDELPKQSNDVLNDIELKYQKSTNNVLISSVKDDAVLRIMLGTNLQSLANRWRMKKNELFGILMPGVQKQTVTNYMKGSSAPPLWVLINLEKITGISISTWLTRAIDPESMPSVPIDANGGEHQIYLVRKELRALLDRLGG